MISSKSRAIHEARALSRAAQPAARTGKTRSSCLQATLFTQTAAWVKEGPPPRRVRRAARSAEAEAFAGLPLARCGKQRVEARVFGIGPCRQSVQDRGCKRDRQAAATTPKHSPTNKILMPYVDGPGQAPQLMLMLGSRVLTGYSGAKNGRKHCNSAKHCSRLCSFVPAA